MHTDYFIWSTNINSSPIAEKALTTKRRWFHCIPFNVIVLMLTQLFIQKQSLVVCEMSSHNCSRRTWICHFRVLCDMKWKSFQYESENVGKKFVRSSLCPHFPAYYSRWWTWSHTNVDFINHLIKTQIEN